ncbi:MAG TPA: GNAT family protein [Rubrobacteraceae bacterium]|nr:GNAT family protein [Rubrobacteraceae bacterium]
MALWPRPAPLVWGTGHRSLARAVMRYAFEDLRFAEIVASTDAPNGASIRVMERLGMEFEKRITTGGLDTVYYKTERERFRPGGGFYEAHP